MISWHIRLVVYGVVLILFIVLGELMRRKYLRPEYALVWAAINILLLLLATFPQLVSLLSWCTGMNYQSSVLMLAFILICAMFVNFTLITCRHGRRIMRLAQEVALLRMELERLQRNAESSPKSRDAIENGPAI